MDWMQMIFIFLRSLFRSQAELATENLCAYRKPHPRRSRGSSRLLRAGPLQSGLTSALKRPEPADDHRCPFGVGSLNRRTGGLRRWCR